MRLILASSANANGPGKSWSAGFNGSFSNRASAISGSRDQRFSANGRQHANTIRPVGAIAPDTRLDAEQLPFIELNAAFYPKPDGKLPPTSKLAPVIEAPLVRSRAGEPLRVAIA